MVWIDSNVIKFFKKKRTNMLYCFGSRHIEVYVPLNRYKGAIKIAGRYNFRVLFQEVQCF